MTYGILKKRIFSLLDLEAEDAYTEGTLAASIAADIPSAINAMARKAALCLKSIFRVASFRFEKDEVGVSTTLTFDAASVRDIRAAGRVYGAESFEVIGGRLFFFGAGEGIYEVGYYAYPDEIGENTDGLTELALDDYFWDTVAYGVCAELCYAVYPSDMKRYMRLATEFDERMTAAFPRSGDCKISNTFFAKRRGIG